MTRKNEELLKTKLKFWNILIIVTNTGKMTRMSDEENDDDTDSDDLDDRDSEGGDDDESDTDKTSNIPQTA